MFGFDQGRRHFVIQFGSSITPQDETFLKAQGIEIQQYIPDDALLVRSTSQAAALAKSASARIRAVSLFEAEWKISPDLLAAPGSFSDSTSRQSILVSALDPLAAREVARQLGRIPGVRVESLAGRDVVVAASIDHLQQIAQIDEVEWIEPAPIFVSFVMPSESEPSVRTAAKSTITGYESGTKLMNFEAAWKRGFRGQGQIVAVADTGLDTGRETALHKDFGESFNQGFLSGMGTESWGDTVGHGTHVAGSVAGTGSISDSEIRGGAYEAKLDIQCIWSQMLNNLAPSTNVATLMDPIYNDGARIQTNSWGNARNFGTYDTFAARMDEYMWNHPDLLILFAAGNSGADMDADGIVDEDSIGSPGTAKNVLTVGASKNLILEGGNQKRLKERKDAAQKWSAEPLASSKMSETPDGLAAFSSRGPTKDGRLKPEIVAPGTNIVSTRTLHENRGKESLLWGEYDQNYVYSGGTSMSTPLTAGAAAVVREFLIKARGIAQPSAALIKATLVHTAHDLFPGQFGTGPKQELAARRPNVHEGYGRVDMDAATRLSKETQLVDEKSGVAVSERQTLRVALTRAGALRATLAYTDAPASAAASRALVNDLDLKIIGPDGKVYQKQDRINNAEMLELTDLKAGAYEIVVEGVNVPRGKSGKQPYALVVTQL